MFCEAVLIRQLWVVTSVRASDMLVEVSYCPANE
jgi:hypothetical protein